MILVPGRVQGGCGQFPVSRRGRALLDTAVGGVVAVVASLQLPASFSLAFSCFSPSLLPFLGLPDWTRSYGDCLESRREGVWVSQANPSPPETPLGSALAFSAEASWAWGGLTLKSLCPRTSHLMPASVQLGADLSTLVAHPGSRVVPDTHPCLSFCPNM